MIFQSAQVWGNLISSAVLQRSDKSTNSSSGYDVSEVCGANDCGQGTFGFIVFILGNASGFNVVVLRPLTFRP